MNYSIAQESRIGGRKVNQDRAGWLATPDALLMVVADGMGGHLHGEVAAQIAVDTMVDRFRAEARTVLADPARFLTATLNQVHQAIARYATESRILPHAAPRTTCIACIVQNGQARWAHAGDSRLYLIRDGAAEVVRTSDHSLVQRMVDDGSLSRAEATTHPWRNRIFSCLGGDTPPHIEISPVVPLQDGDLIALCTDGAWWPLGESLVSGLANGVPLQSSVPGLLDAAERAAGADADNLTLIAMRWQLPDPDGVTCDMARSVPPGRELPAISDEELERAVAEIRRRIPFDTPGAPS